MVDLNKVLESENTVTDLNSINTNAITGEQKLKLVDCDVITTKHGTQMFRCEFVTPDGISIPVSVFLNQLGAWLRQVKFCFGITETDNNKIIEELMKNFHDFYLNCVTRFDNMGNVNEYYNIHWLNTQALNRQK